MSVLEKEIVTINGVSGRAYRFTVYPKSYNWNSVSGVYIILRKGIGGRYSTIYVGETEDLGTRFRDHHKAWCFESHQWTHLAFLHESLKSIRLAIEADIFANYQFPCNG